PLPHPFLPLTARQDQVLSAWLTDYVGAPHPRLGRDGAVCPFVRPALRAGSLRTARCRWRPGDGPAGMEALIHAAMDAFDGAPTVSRNAALDSLIVVFDGLERPDWWLIDEAHRTTKDAAVARGLMLGQMHPECTAPASRNPLFPVNRSPYPLIAIRPMAFHDILFLHQNPAWFEKYRTDYGHHYRSPAKVDPVFVSLFDAGALMAAGGSLV
ncbi:DUF6875 domain-containing protein, partial [Streptomyces sp. URMC 129]|uniref:DUF6875 domain-containing protein n=1 Tax=Streptomyces sp. URMC 129 TaxID=3423407 RepID=UPI003F1D9AE7